MQFASHCAPSRPVMGDSGLDGHVQPEPLLAAFPPPHPARCISLGPRFHFSDVDTRNRCPPRVPTNIHSIPTPHLRVFASLCEPQNLPTKPQRSQTGLSYPAPVTYPHSSHPSSKLLSCPKAAASCRIPSIPTFVSLRLCVSLKVRPRNQKATTENTEEHREIKEGGHLAHFIGTAPQVPLFLTHLIMASSPSQCRWSGTSPWAARSWVAARG
jgi:hypothetical protein